MINHPSMPAKGTRHTLMFSATFPEAIQRLAANYLNEYLFLTVGVVGAASTDVTQTFLEVGHREKRDKLDSVLRDLSGEKTLVRRARGWGGGLPMTSLYLSRHKMIVYIQ